MNQALVITDGDDQHSVRSTARDISAEIKELRRRLNENAGVLLRNSDEEIFVQAERTSEIQSKRSGAAIVS